MLKKKLFNKISNFMIIGLGNIGMRHFQSLSNLDGLANFYLVDPKFRKKNNTSADALKNRYITKGRKNIFFYKDVEDINLKEIFFDLTIIASNSDMRFFLFEKVVLFTNTKYIILEKFLFNKLIHYKKAILYCKQKKQVCFVNQWLCQSTKIRKILNKFKNHELDVTVEGTEWGMACNIVHFIDLIRYFKVDDLQTPKILSSNLKKKIRQTKRKGFYELYGNISIRYGKHNLSINCNTGNFSAGTTPYGIDIQIKKKKTNKSFLKFNLKSGNISGYEKAGGNTYYFSEKIELISQLTGEIFERLKQKKKIYLPTLEQSINQHEIVFKLFSRHFKKIMKTEIDTCPVT